MDVSNWIREAEQGNAAAMLCLGRYYEESDPEQAEGWYARAADADVLLGMEMEARMKQIRAVKTMAASSFDGRRLKEELDVWLERAGRFYTAVGRRAGEADERMKRAAVELYHDAVYWSALYDLVKRNDYEAIVRRISAMEDRADREEVLLGKALWLLAETAEEYQTALQHMRVVQKTAYMEKKKTEGFEQMLYADAAVGLAVAYRQGGRRGKRAGCRAAYAWLCLAETAVQYEEARRIIREERKRYKKTIFGGYRYVQSGQAAIKRERPAIRWR